MTPALVQPWIALALGLGAVALVASALGARSLVISVLSMMAAGALIAVSLLAFNYQGAALAQGLIGVGLAPVLFLAGLLLSARTVQANRSPWTWVTGVLAGGVAALLLWTVFAAGAGRTHAAAIVAGHSSVLALAPLLLALAAACAALLGFGERGALAQPAKGRQS